MFQHRRYGPIMTFIRWIDNKCLAIMDYFKNKKWKRKSNDKQR